MEFKNLKINVLQNLHFENEGSELTSGEANNAFHSLSND